MTTTARTEQKQRTSAGGALKIINIPAGAPHPSGGALDTSDSSREGGNMLIDPIIHNGRKI